MSYDKVKGLFGPTNAIAESVSYSTTRDVQEISEALVESVPVAPAVAWKIECPRGFVEECQAGAALLTIELGPPSPRLSLKLDGDVGG